MIKTFTENDLIRFLYNELSNKESEEIERAILTDDVLQEQISTLRKLHKDMDRLQVSPSGKTVQKILEFSKG